MSRIYNTIRIYSKSLKFLKRSISLFIIYILLIEICLVINCGKPGKNDNNQSIKTSSIKVATYNVRFFEKGIRGLIKTIHRLDPDIIALQEVLIKNGEDMSGKLSLNKKYYHASSLPYVNYGREKWVLSFLSIYPIISRQEKWIGKRKAFKIVVHAGDTKLKLITLHLSPFVWSNSNLLAANLNRSKRRQEEIRLLLEWVGKPDMPSIILGDFNSVPFMGELQPLFDSGYKDIFEITGQENTGTFPVNKRYLSIARKKIPFIKIPEVIGFDYILLGGGLNALSAKVFRSDASDHYPLIGEIEYRSQ